MSQSFRVPKGAGIGNDALLLLTYRALELIEEGHRVECDLARERENSRPGGLGVALETFKLDLSVRIYGATKRVEQPFRSVELLGHA